VNVDELQRIGAIISRNWLAFLIGAVVGASTATALYERFLLPGLQAQVEQLKLTKVTGPPPVTKPYTTEIRSDKTEKPVRECGQQHWLVLRGIDGPRNSTIRIIARVNTLPFAYPVFAFDTPIEPGMEEMKIPLPCQMGEYSIAFEGTLWKKEPAVPQASKNSEDDEIKVAREPQQLHSPGTTRVSGSNLPLGLQRSRLTSLERDRQGKLGYSPERLEVLYSFE